MSVAELLDKVSGLSAEERQELFIGAAEKMPLLEVIGMVKAMEEKWDVKASGGGGVMMAAPAATGGGDDDAEQTEFTVMLTGAGEKKIAVIKVVRGITGLNLKEAKALVDKAPVAVKEKVSKDEAEKAKGELEEAGATVELK